ncbi:amidohydrolase family protein [Belliella marina]|uniref:Amidohydrolase family protein n=1 Tax=Belliella marina TaxID=1644146 RepID=A0ABW4VSF1_9BACT
MHIIDTHIHIWDVEKISYPWLEGAPALLNRTYTLEELNGSKKPKASWAGVLVQASNNREDTVWMLKVASQQDWIEGVVGWLPLMEPEKVATELESSYAKQSLLKGVRHLIHDEIDPEWLLQEKVIESLKLIEKQGLSYDFVGVNAAHLKTALKLSEKIPGLKMIFDHCNQPPNPNTQEFALWSDLMKQASGNKNFYAKISGLGTATGKGEAWGAEDIVHGVGKVLEYFGEDRCMCGGDWPVSLLAGSYQHTWGNYLSVFDQLISDETVLQKILAKNAMNFYNLKNIQS